MTNVKTLFRDTLPGEPVSQVVEKLRELLADAEAGDIRAIAYVAVRVEPRITRGWFHDYGEGHRLSTGIMQLSSDYARAWDDDE